jgi:hypothetical protein
MQKNFFLLFFCWHLVNDEIEGSVAWIRGSGSGSTPKCHGSATLMATLLLCGQCKTVPHIDLDHEYALVHC